MTDRIFSFDRLVACYFHVRILAGFDDLFPGFQTLSAFNQNHRHFISKTPLFPGPPFEDRCGQGLALKQGPHCQWSKDLISLTFSSAGAMP